MLIVTGISSVCAAEAVKSALAKLAEAAPATGASCAGGGGTGPMISAPRTPLVQKRRNRNRFGSKDRRKVTYTSQTSKLPSPKAMELMSVSLPLNRPLDR